jgi:rhamnopyranosyl-N-acetylglucosaminyl-diphospho-decaprenol beta-1,3/1,4-galactofuranosyltransferase
MKLSVVALVATYHRPKELARLLDSLAAIESGLIMVVIVDNGNSDEVRAVVEHARCSTHYVNPGANLGCGGGLRLAGQRAQELAGRVCTHFLVLDDDAVVAPNTVEVLAAAMEANGADLASPLVVDARGKVGWIPGVVEVGREMERAGDLTPEQFRERFGDAPRDFVWTQGICLLVARGAVEKHGWHRDDFWVRGEDLDFSLRLTSQARGIFVPAAVVKHLPPSETSAVSREAEYLKHCALLQNMAYLGIRLPHGHRIAWTIPGALRRFLHVWGWGGRTIGDALRALWRGVKRGQPAGSGEGKTFRALCAELGGAS